MRHSKILQTQLKRVLVATLIFNFIFCGICFAGFYRYNVDELARKAQKRIKETERKIARQEIKEKLGEVLVRIQDLFKKGEELFSQGKYKEAAELYREIDKISRDEEVKKWLEKATKY